MPSVLVLVLGNDSALSNVADAVVAGAKRVRFTEVAVQAAEPNVFRYHALDRDASIASYDGIVVVASDSAQSVDALNEIVGTQELTNTVVARAGGSDIALSAALVGLGAIVVSAADDAIGERVAKVAGWVRHALGHEAEHHHHDHDHHHHGHEHKHHDHHH